MAGYPPPNQYPYPPQGGAPPQGYPPQHHPPQGYPPQSHPPQGPPQGYPPQGYPHQGYPPHGYPPQGQPPHGQHSSQAYPPPGQPPHSQHPPQGQHPPGAASAGYYGHEQHPPQGQYTPSTEPYGVPPPAGAPPHAYQQAHPHGQYPASQQGYQSQGYPPQGYPPQGPPPQAHPPQTHSQGHPPQAHPPHGYAPQGYAPQTGHGAPPVVAHAMPSPGYVPGQMAHGDASREADALRKAFKGFGTDKLTLVEVLTKPDALQMALISHTFQVRHQRDLEKDIEKECSGKFETVMLALVRGPLMQDVYALKKALKGIGTNERLLNDVLVSRSNADMHAIKQAYQKTFGKSLEADVRSDLSMQTEQLFNLIMAGTRAEESTPLNQYQIDQDIVQLHGAMSGNTGTPKTTVWQILTQRSDNQLRALSDAYSKKHNKALSAEVTARFSGHVRDVLVHMLSKAVRPALHDALALEDTMAGPGTNDSLLIERLVRIHWNKAHLEQVKEAFAKRYSRSLRTRVASETSGDYEKALLAIVQ